MQYVSILKFLKLVVPHSRPWDFFCPENGSLDALQGSGFFLLHFYIMICLQNVPSHSVFVSGTFCQFITQQGDKQLYKNAANNQNFTQLAIFQWIIRGKYIHRVFQLLRSLHSETGETKTLLKVNHFLSLRLHETGQHCYKLGY